MKILLLFIFIILLSSCVTVEVAKEVTKAGKSIGTSVNNLIKNSQNNNEDNLIKRNNKNDITANNKKMIDQELANLKKEKEKEKKLAKKQKNKIRIDFLNKTINEIRLIIGGPQLTRVDGNSKIFRFDSNYCRLFLFFNEKNKNSKVEYFEIRNNKGLLIINNEEIEKCYKDLRLI